MVKSLFDYEKKDDNNNNLNESIDKGKSNTIKELEEESRYLSAKILIVDDSEFHISQCAKALKKIGYRNIESFDNPIDLIANLREANPDLILMDTEMGVSMKGFDAAKQIKNGNYNKKIAIIGMSMNPNYKENWMESGADNFIAKKDLEFGIVFENMIKDALKKYR